MEFLWAHPPSKHTLTQIAYPTPYFVTYHRDSAMVRGRVRYVLLYSNPNDWHWFYYYCCYRYFHSVSLPQPLPRLEVTTTPPTLAPPHPDAASVRLTQIYTRIHIRRMTG